MIQPVMFSIVALLILTGIEWQLGKHTNYEALLVQVARLSLAMCAGLAVAALAVIALVFNEEVLKLLMLAALPPIVIFIGVFAVFKEGSNDQTTI